MVEDYISGDGDEKGRETSRRGRARGDRSGYAVSCHCELSPKMCEFKTGRRTAHDGRGEGRWESVTMEQSADASRISH